MTRTLLILSITFLFACGHEAEQNDNSGQETKIVTVKDAETEQSFQLYSNQIPKINLPLRLKCEEEPAEAKLNLTQSAINKFGPDNSRIYGKIAETKDFTAIIYLAPADLTLPIIQTTDKEGNKISELQVYENWCGEDEFGWGMSWAKINNDLTVLLSDSVISYKRDGEGEIIEQSRETKVRHRAFAIDKAGKIVEKENGL